MPINLCELKKIEGLKAFDGEALKNHIITDEEVRHLFELCDALWLHSGNPADPHAEMTSGKCSNAFIDTLRALRYSYLCQFMAEQLVKKMFTDYPHLSPIDWVVGSDHAGATLSHSVALCLNAQHDFTEKGENKTHLWKRFDIQPNEQVLQVEELITTAGTLQAVRDGIRAGNPHRVIFAPLVMTLIHRSPVYEFEGSPILYLIHFDIQSWEPSACPLCAAGSKKLRPKQHWKELTTGFPPARE